MSESPKSLQDIFKNIDIDKGIYKFNGTDLKINDLTVTQLESLQDEEAKIKDLEGAELSAKETLKIVRGWQTYILDTAFGNAWKTSKIKEKCSASQFANMVNEVLFFLGRFGGPEGARAFMNISKAQKN